MDGKKEEAEPGDGDVDAVPDRLSLDEIVQEDDEGRLSYRRRFKWTGPEVTHCKNV